MGGLIGHLKIDLGKEAMDGENHREVEAERLREMVAALVKEA